MLFKIIPKDNPYSYVSICNKKIISILDFYLNCKINFKHTYVASVFDRAILDKLQVSNDQTYSLKYSVDDICIDFYNTIAKGLSLDKSIISLKCSAELIKSLRDKEKATSYISNYMTGFSYVGNNTGYIFSTGSTTATTNISYYTYGGATSLRYPRY